MKNILKKNQVIIAALAIMIVVAGYLNFTQDKIKDTTKGNETVSSDAVLEASSQEGAEAAEGSSVTDVTGEASANVDPNASVSPAATVTPSGTKTTTEDITSDDGTNVGLTEEELELTADGSDGSQASVTDTGEVVTETGSTENVGDAVLANSSIGSEFFSAAKLSREQTRAKNKETLMEIIDNKNVTEEQKQNAIDSMINFTSITEKENVTETLLQAKGFTEVVVTIVDDGVDVVVNANTLTEQQMAQIEDVVKRKTGIASKNIVISPVKVVDQQ